MRHDQDGIHYASPSSSMRRVDENPSIALEDQP
jgi:hypothetical protein